MASLLTQRVDVWRRQYRLKVIGTGLARLISLTIVGVIALLAIDQAFLLPQRARLLALAAAALLIAAAAWRWLVAPWLRAESGALVDAAAWRYPEARQYLRPAWDLSLHGSRPGTSDSLRRAHIEATDRLLASLPDRAVFEWQWDKRLRLAVLAALGMSLSLPWLASPSAWDRILRPWRDVPLERLVNIAPGSAQVDWGRSVTIVAQWQDQAPATRARHELKLSVRGAGGWRQAVWDKVSGGEFRFTAEDITTPLRYRLAWRDLVSQEYELVPVSMPQLDSVRARLHGAEPTMLPLTPEEPLSVVRGTFITIAGRPNQPLARAALRLSSQPQPILMKLSAAGEFEAGFVAQEDALMRFELQSRDGRTDRDPPSYSLRTLADAPPTVELLSPLQPLQAGTADTIPIAYSAKDDGGLSRVSLLVRPQGRPEREIVLERFSGRRDFLGDYSWELAGLPLGRVEFQLKAVDNAASGQAAFSAKSSVDIVDFEAGHAQLESLWRKAEHEIKSAASRAERLSEQLRAQRPAAQELDALAREWAQASLTMKQLAEAMAQDPYANPGLAEQVSDAAESMGAASRRDVPQAQQAAKTGEMPDASNRHEQLGKQMRKAERLLAEGRKLQGLQDFYSQTGRMAQAGASLEASLEPLARGAKASPEAKAKLDETLSKIQKQLADLQKSIESLPQASPDGEASRRQMQLPVQSARETADALSKAIARGDFTEAARLARKLSEDLAKIQQSLSSAASQTAASSLPRELAQRIEQAQALWSEVVEDQTRLVERTQKIEDAKMARKIAAQRDLLAELGRRQHVLVTSVTAQAGFPADVLSSMRAVLAEFMAKSVQNAPTLLKGVTARLRAEATVRPASGAAYLVVATAEEQILAELEKAAQSGAERAGPEAEEAGRAQGAVKQKTKKLQGELESLEAQLGEIPGGVIGKIAAAQDEQSAAVEALGRRDSAAALTRQHKALELLGEGSGQMSQSASGQQSLQQGMMQPFQRPGGTVRMMRGGSGGSGAQMGFVPLPSAKDYLPPKELREELERSLQESRPESQDALIKEYFKRIAQ